MSGIITKSVVLIVAHPDDETLWAGGTILSHPSWQWFIICLCRGNDKDRAPKFHKALKILKAEGIMAALDDGPEQNPIPETEIQHTILDLLPPKHFDLVITHNPNGEYTKHLRHEEVSRAVITLWHLRKISAFELWTFAYEDGSKAYYPKPIATAPIHRELTKRIWQRKFSLITETYGYDKESFEAETTSKSEAFWQFTDSYVAKKWLNQGGIVKNVLIT
jgi:LmbE family N-acetylglucosaminyl deacetylase